MWFVGVRNVLDILFHIHKIKKLIAAAESLSRAILRVVWGFSRWFSEKHLMVFIHDFVTEKSGRPFLIILDLCLLYRISDVSNRNRAPSHSISHIAYWSICTMYGESNLTVPLKIPLGLVIFMYLILTLRT